jgi:hypothetical protein
VIIVGGLLVVNGGEGVSDDVWKGTASSEVWSVMVMVYCRGGERRLERLQASDASVMASAVSFCERKTGRRRQRMCQREGKRMEQERRLGGASTRRIRRRTALMSADSGDKIQQHGGVSAWEKSGR